MAGVAEVTDQNFDAEILQSETPAIVDFWAEWCAPCRAIAPIIADLAATYGGQVKVVKMNVDENPATPPSYMIRGIPTLLLFKDGDLKETVVGLTDKAELARMIDRHLS